MLFSISSSASLVCQGIHCHYKYKYDLLLRQTATAKGASGRAKEWRPPLCCLFWSLWRPQGDAHTDEHGDPGIILVQGDVTTFLPELVSSDHAEFQPKNPFSLIPPSNLLHPLGHASGRVLGSTEDNARDQSWLWGKCRVFSPSLCYFPAGSVS